MSLKNPNGPRCRYCGKKLIRYWTSMNVPVGTTEAPKVYSCENKKDRRNGQPVLAARSQRHRYTTPKGEVEVKVWLGDYVARGDGPYFCKIACAESFASACVRAGMEIKKK